MAKNFSRFSSMLGDIDLDDMIPKKRAPEKPKKEQEPPKKAHNKPKASKKKADHDSLQALAFGHSGKTKKKAAATNGTGPPAAAAAPAATNNNSSGKKSKANGDCNGKHISDEWKTRDEQFVKEENERELAEAMLLSKLDFEANKQTQSQQKKEEAIANAKAAAKTTKKKKKEKPITVSLSEFNSMDTSKKLSAASRNGIDLSKGSGRNNIAELKDDNFFADVDSAVKSTLQKESRQKHFIGTASKDKSVSLSAKGSGSSGKPTMVKISEVETRDYEIQALRLEVVSLKEQLENFKIRYKKMCDITDAKEARKIGEMLENLEKITKDRNEFSVEVANLSEQLEQEKTKVSQLQDKNRKK